MILLFKVYKTFVFNKEKESKINTDTEMCSCEKQQSWSVI